MNTSESRFGRSSLKRPRPAIRALQAGITLIEVMVVVAIIAVLARIAYPQYTNYVKKGNRAGAQAEMMQVANAQQQYLLINRAYANSTSLLNTTFSSTVNSQYTCAITNPAGVAVSFLITCTPLSTGPQAGDVTLTLSSDGTKGPSGSW